MMLISTLKTRGFLLPAALGIVLGSTSPVHALQAWYILDLESKKVTQIGSGSGYNNVRATAINDTGQVVGTFKTNTGAIRSFITGPDGMGMRDLGTLGGSESFANGINDTGQVVGNSSTAEGTHAFITGPDGMGMRDLGTLGGNYSFASGINEAGPVVGQSSTAEGDHAFITSPNGMEMRDPGTLGGEDSGASDINETGQLAGWSLTAHRHRMS